ncbi:MAG TPA: hypothetical protein VGN46_05565 [Luteibacter sp.]|jgi:hypothetical protein|uniref:hypothetical protein n=1 Tax=Luteibacter sp. TaxID=1886636 RepID=UPI002F4067D1
MVARSPQGKTVYDVVRNDVPMRHWTILAQDPSILGAGGKALTTTVRVPSERLERGPKGFRVHVIDYDASSDTFYRARDKNIDTDPYVKVTDIEKLVRDPYFHQQNVYAIAMATLQAFEGALGRTVPWGFPTPSHQIKVAPHAFADANAYYSRESESLNFGYFPDQDGKQVFTCLSHDIVVHETAHALLDGLRSHYLLPSSTDQAAFHEGFSDIVALLSVFQSQPVIDRLLAPLTARNGRLAPGNLTASKLGGTHLAELAEQMGAALSGVPTSALRTSLSIRPDKRHYTSARFEEEHDRGELLVAIVLGAFFEVWARRLKPLLQGHPDGLARAVVSEEGTTAASQLLRIMIRALDYMPPVDLTFGDFLSALLTADLQLYPDDTRYRYRDILKHSFESYGVSPASHGRSDGAWDPPRASEFTLAGTHFERMQRDPLEVFRFVWENKAALGVEPNAFTRVTSVRPVMRISNDQTVLRETVAEYVQQLTVYGSELTHMGIRRPEGMPTNRLINLYGGGTLVFNEYGLLKFHIATGVKSPRQSDRLQSLWDRGYFAKQPSASARIASLHRDRVLRPHPSFKEAW